jgi:hypothetical protein
MKRILKIAALALVVLAGSLPLTASAQYNDDGYAYNDNNSYNDGYGDREVDYQDFYDELSPHGRWVDYPGHGYVWIPNAGPDFRPYSTNGHWVWSDNYEWMWVSDYDWGWAPFHYGRWDNDPYYGWYWVPGYEWSPAWVAWRDGGDYYGWAPIRPGINISVNFNIGGYAPPVDFWCFTPRRYITYPRIASYCVPWRQNTTIINHTTIIVNNYRYGGSYGFRSGPRRYDAERYIGRINPVRFRQSNTPGRTVFRNNEVSVYRPNIRRDNNRTIAPRNFERYDRNNGGFRNNGSNNNGGVVRNNDNNRFERRDNNPNRVGSTDNNRFERRTVEPRQPQSNGNSNNPGNRRFERNSNDNNTPNPNRERRVNMPTREPNTGNGQAENRRFERRTENNGNSSNPAREPRVRSNDAPRPQQMERRSEPRPQQMERRSEPRPQQQQPRQFERRQETRPQPQQQQQQQRQIERRDNGSSNRQQGNSSSGNGNGNGRGKNRF